MAALRAATALALAALRLAAAAPATLRPPAVPLAVSTPFFSIWAFDAASLAGTKTSQWHGDPATLDALVRVDGSAYVLMGASPAAPAARQLGLPTVSALSSTFAFAAGGVNVTLRFTTPALPGDALASSRAGTYVSFELASADGAPHRAEVLFDASGEVVTGDYDGEMLEWDRPNLNNASGGLLAMRIGLVGQRVPGGFNLSAHLRASTEPHQKQDFGFVYVLADGGGSGRAQPSASLIAPAGDVHAAFVAGGSANMSRAADAAPPASAAASGAAAVVAAVAFDLGELPADGTPARARALLLGDEVATVLNYETLLPPVWRADVLPIGDTSVVPVAGLVRALADADALLAAADAFDAALAPRLAAAGGSAVADVAQLVFRQVTGANGVALNGSGAVWAFQKEISSDGDMSTLDVIFPSAAQHLAFDDASGLVALLDPVLFIMAGFSPARFDQPCALHSVGKWPVVDAGNGGCSMPMESTGDVLILSAAATMARGGDAGWAQAYLPTLRRFAAFCEGALPWPAFQDMTDDFSHAPGNLTNLALKCILGVGAQGYMEHTVGNASGAAALFASARAFGEGFARNGVSSEHPGFKFIYNETWDASYGLMYNSFWARLLGLEALIPNFYALFSAHYAFLQTVTANATWCIPLSSIEKDSKWDWLAYTAATMFTNSTPPAPSSYTEHVHAQIVFFANTTSSRFPLSDHPECIGASSRSCACACTHACPPSRPLLYPCMPALTSPLCPVQEPTPLPPPQTARGPCLARFTRRS
jgi:hypothetical protein